MGNKKKFNFIDILILIVLVAGLFFGFRKLKSSKPAATEGSSSQKILISYYIEEVPDFVAQSIEKGDLVKEEVQSSSFGSVVDKSVDKSVFWARDNEGNLFKSSKEGYKSMTLTMEAEGLIGQQGVTIDKASYYLGQTASLFVGKTRLENGRISDIKAID